MILRRIVRARNGPAQRCLVAVLAVATALLVLAAPPASAVSIITIPDSSGVGRFTSLVLDSNSYPVVSYYDQTNGALKILHCNDPHCAGGDESITSPDTVGVLDLLSSDAAFRTSLALDSGGYPVVSYYDATSDDLKILHCNDPNCADGGESIISPDPSGNTGGHTSLALDSDGYPVVSYYDHTNGEIKILHCNDPDCAGSDESITSPDPSGTTGGHTSLALDTGGNPVVSYSSKGGSGGDLKLLHCNDPNCADGDESITLPDTESTSVFYTSLELDSSGNPVVSFWNGGPDKLRVVQCNDPNCVGGDESVSEPDSILGGLHTSLALGPDDSPVVSYYREADALMVLRCTMAECVEGGTISGQVPWSSRPWPVSG